MKLKQLREEQSSQIQIEFEELTDRLDKFRLVLIYPELRCLLSNRDDEYFRLIQKAFSLTYKMKIENEAISLISNHVDGAERAAYAKQIFKDMHFIYDEFMDLNKELENKLYAMRQKRDAAAAPLEELASALDLAGELEIGRRNQTLHRAVLELPERYREAVVLCELTELSYEEAAAVIGCPVGTVRSRLHRARHMLLGRLVEKGIHGVR